MLPPVYRLHFRKQLKASKAAAIAHTYSRQRLTQPSSPFLTSLPSLLHITHSLPIHTVPRLHTPSHLSSIYSNNPHPSTFAHRHLTMGLKHAFTRLRQRSLSSPSQPPSSPTRLATPPPPYAQIDALITRRQLSELCTQFGMTADDILSLPDETLVGLFEQLGQEDEAEEEWGGELVLGEGRRLEYRRGGSRRSTNASTQTRGTSWRENGKEGAMVSLKVSHTPTNPTDSSPSRRQTPSPRLGLKFLGCGGRRLGAASAACWLTLPGPRRGSSSRPARSTPPPPPPLGTPHRQSHSFPQPLLPLRQSFASPPGAFRTHRHLLQRPHLQTSSAVAMLRFRLHLRPRPPPPQPPPLSPASPQPHRPSPQVLVLPPRSPLHARLAGLPSMRVPHPARSVQT